MQQEKRRRLLERGGTEGWIVKESEAHDGGDFSWNQTVVQGSHAGPSFHRLFVVVVVVLSSHIEPLSF